MNFSSVCRIRVMEEEGYEFPFPYREIKAALTPIMKWASFIKPSREFCRRVPWTRSYLRGPSYSAQTRFFCDLRPVVGIAVDFQRTCRVDGI